MDPISRWRMKLDRCNCLLAFVPLRIITNHTSRVLGFVSRSYARREHWGMFEQKTSRSRWSAERCANVTRSSDGTRSSGSLFSRPLRARFHEISSPWSSTIWEWILDEYTIYPFSKFSSLQDRKIYYFHLMRYIYLLAQTRKYRNLNETIYVLSRHFPIDSLGFVYYSTMKLWKKRIDPSCNFVDFAI